MKKGIIRLALAMLALVAVLLFTGAAMAEDALLASACEGEIKLYQSEMTALYDSTLADAVAYYAENGYMMDEYDTELQSYIASTIVNQQAQQRVLERYAAQKGYELTAEKAEEIEATATAYEQSYREYYESYLAAYGYSGDALNELVDQMLAEQGMDHAYIVSQLQLQDKLLFIKDLETADVTVSEEDVAAAYEAKLAEQKTAYDENVDTFIDAAMNGEEVLYTPDGIRKMHIIYVQTEEATEGEPSKIEAVQAALAGGTAFDDVAKEYDESGSFTDDGELMAYYVAAGSTSYSEDFLNAAMALNKGEVSEPVMSGNGGFILEYHEDLPGGSVALADRVETETAALLESRQEETFEAAISRIIDEANIVVEDLSVLYHVKEVYSAYGSVESETALTAAPAGETVASVAAGASVKIIGSITADGVSYDFVTIPGTEYKGYLAASAIAELSEEEAAAVANADLVTPANAAGTPIFTIAMEDGSLIYGELYPETAPESVGNFIALADSGFYNDLIFHRVIAGFMIQGGDPAGNGTGGPGYAIKGEFSANGVENDIKHERGVLSMARSSAMDSAGSQFFIMHADAEHLDGQYAAFGRVLGGMDTVDVIASQPTNSSDAPTTAQRMQGIWVEHFGQEYPFTKLED